MGIYKRGRIYWLALTVDGKHICLSTGCTNKRMAQKVLDLRKAQIIEGRFGLPKSNPPTLKEWAEQFLESIQHANTKRSYKSCIQTLNEFFGAGRLSEITPDRIELFKTTRLKSGAGPAIINRNLAVLRRMLKLAARQRLIIRTPFEEVDFLEERSHRRQPRILGFDEQVRLEAVAPPLLRTLVVLLTEAGLRVGREALRLTWDDVDLIEGLVYVRDSKTMAGRRVVPMSEHCRTTLQEWKIKIGDVFSPFVFGNPSNPAVHLKSVRKSWTRTLRLAKLPYFPVYCLRATFASRLSAAGASDNIVAGMLGHSSPAILSTYAKLIDEFRHQAIQKLEKFRVDQTARQVQPDHHREAGTSAAIHRWLN